jgi:hypothetical protein
MIENELKVDWEEKGHEREEQWIESEAKDCWNWGAMKSDLK